MNGAAFRSRHVMGLLGAVVLGAVVSSTPLAAQLGSRPAEEWSVTLEAKDRLDRLGIEEIVSRLGLEPGDVVADIGAGTGVFSIPMAREVAPEGVVLAVEIDPGFFPIIEAKASASEVDNVEPVLAESLDPKLPRYDVDVAFFHHVLHHVQYRQAYLIALAQYMQRGSRIVVVDYDMSVAGGPHSDQPGMLIGPDQVVTWLRNAGFAQTQKFDLFEDRFFLVFTKQR